MYTLIFLVLSGLLIGGVEVIKRKYLISPNITRRVTHICAALIAVAASFFIDKTIIIISCIGFSFLLLWGRKRSLFTSINSINRKSYGDVYFPLGEALAAFILLPDNIKPFQFGILVLGISDAVAGSVGEKYGKHPITFLKNNKSYEGALVFCLCTFFLTSIFISGIGLHLVFIPLVLTVIELGLGDGTDNLALPIWGGVLISLVYI
ncbi:MAG: hypothetical protein Q7T54_02425 [Candidatus Levybacteria bacterium]|nr:hypothetical protein [Candidatus Levybacteria bacterium]